MTYIMMACLSLFPQIYDYRIVFIALGEFWTVIKSIRAQKLFRYTLHGV